VTCWQYGEERFTPIAKHCLDALQRAGTGDIESLVTFWADFPDGELRQSIDTLRAHVMQIIGEHKVHGVPLATLWDNLDGGPVLWISTFIVTHHWTLAARFRGAQAQRPFGDYAGIHSSAYIEDGRGRVRRDLYARRKLRRKSNRTDYETAQVLDADTMPASAVYTLGMNALFTFKSIWQLVSERLSGTEAKICSVDLTNFLGYMHRFSLPSMRPDDDRAASQFRALLNGTPRRQLSYPSQKQWTDFYNKHMSRFGYPGFEGGLFVPINHQAPYLTSARHFGAASAINLIHGLLAEAERGFRGFAVVSDDLAAFERSLFQTFIDEET